MIAGRTRSVSLGLGLIAVLTVFIGATAYSNAVPLKDDVVPQGQATDVSSIRWQRTVLIASGQTARATQFAVAVTDHVNQLIPEAGVKVYAEVLGDVGKLHWFVDYESLAQLEAFSERLAADEVYNQMLADIEGAFVPGHIHDTVYELLP